MQKFNQLIVINKEEIMEYGKQDLFMRETYEMLYQYDRNYFFDSTKIQ